jgi:Spy/CpxP family protein refolding chaperone
MKVLAFAVLAFAAVQALAQHQPYAGQQARDLKALSAEEVKQYLSGAGMGYARPAELNRYPGPMHVLELADKLDLTPSQRASTKALMDAHKAQARALGAKRVESERVIESLFRSGEASEAALAKAVQAAAALEGEYRLSHLDTHRRMRALLTEEQVERYEKLRGYADGGVHTGRH